MLETGFHVYWCILDGANVNRQFVKLHFQGEDEAVEKRFTAQNLYTGEPFVFMMDSKVNNLKNETKGLNLTSAVLCQKRPHIKRSYLVITLDKPNA